MHRCGRSSNFDERQLVITDCFNINEINLNKFAPFVPRYAI